MNNNINKAPENKFEGIKFFNNSIEKKMVALIKILPFLKKKI